MSKVLKGSCNWCGSCCGYGTYPKCAFPYAWWKWDKMHPDEGRTIVKAVKAKIGENANVSGKINIKGVGQITFYLSEEGLQTSETDKTCPFFDQTTHACKIWNTRYIPDICKVPEKSVPQTITDEQKREKWKQDHPNCGFYWEEE